MYLSAIGLVIAAYSTAEIDHECSTVSKFVERVALARDQGLKKEVFDKNLPAYVEQNRITEEVYARAVIIVEWVYKWKEVTPNDLAFSYKDQCIDNMLEVEEI